MPTEYRRDNLSAKSVNSVDPNDIIDDEYDIAIIPSGWDRRCLGITKVNKIRIKETLFIKYSLEKTF